MTAVVSEIEYATGRKVFRSGICFPCKREIEIRNAVYHQMMDYFTKRPEQLRELKRIAREEKTA
jgi:hypothetical protein